MAEWEELKALSPEFDSMNPQQFMETIHRRYAPSVPFEKFATTFGYKIPTNPSPLLSMLPQSVERGVRSAQQGTNLVFNALGIQDDTSTAARVSELERRKEEIAPTGSVGEGFKAVQEASKQGWGAAVKAIAANPQILPSIIGESVGSFLPDIALAVATGGVAGPVAKAAAARLGVSKIAPEAISAGAKIATQAGVAGVGSAKTEYGAEVLETLKDAGIDITTSEGFLSGLSNKELIARAQEMGLKKGIPVGIFDMVSMGVAGRILDPALDAARAAGTTISKGQFAARSAGELGVQAGLGAAGEAAGQLAQKGEVSDPASVILEAVAELGTGPAEAALNIRALRKQREQAELRQEEEKATAPTTPGTPEFSEAQRAARLAEERKIAEKSADIALTEDSSQPAPQERTVPEVDWLGREVKPDLVEEQLKQDLANAYSLRGEEFRAVQTMSRKELADLGELALQDNPSLAKTIPNLTQYVKDWRAQKDVKLLPPPAPTTQENLTIEQAQALLNRYKKDPRFAAMVQQEGDPRARASALINELQSSPNPPEAAPPQDRITPQGTVEPQAATRTRDDLARVLSERFKVDPVAIKSLVETFQSGKELKPTQVQQEIKRLTGKPLPLKPAAALQKLLKDPSAIITRPQGESFGPAIPSPAADTPGWDPLQERGVWGQPPSIPGPQWNEVLSQVKQMPPGGRLSIPRLMSMGLTQPQAEDARSFIRKMGGVESMGNMRKEPSTVPYANTLAPHNALNFLKNEFNGKNYGCM